MTRNCSECGRYLPSLRSQRLGIGPKCRKRLARIDGNSFKLVQRQSAHEYVRRNAMTKVKPGVYRVRSGANTYMTSWSACNCASGRYRPLSGSCKHQYSVRLKESR